MNQKTGRMLLFFIGCVLTFNLGRDITLITLYPFVFGYVEPVRKVASRFP